MRRERRKAYFPTEDLPTRNFTKAACALKFYTHSHFLRNILEGWCRRKDAAQKELPARISLECSSDGERHPLRHFLNNSCVGICSVQTRTLVHSDELTSVRKIVFRTQNSGRFCSGRFLHFWVRKVGLENFAKIGRF